jgi:hypothetical protein
MKCRRAADVNVDAGIIDAHRWPQVVNDAQCKVVAGEHPFAFAPYLSTALGAYPAAERLVGCVFWAGMSEPSPAWDRLSMFRLGSRHHLQALSGELDRLQLRVAV